MRALEYFREVADTGSFSRAAKSFGVPASSVSRRVQALEAELGVTLLHRTTRVVKLTEFGSLYLAQVRPALAALADAADMVRERPGAPAGRLAITAPHGYGGARLVPALEKLRALYPDLVFDIELTDHVTNLAGNEVDIAVRATSEPPERAVARKLSDNRFLFVAAPAYLERYGTPGRLADLQHHRMILYRGSTGVLSWQAKTAAGWQQVPANPVLVTNAGPLIRDEVLRGSGLALVPEWGMEDHLETGRLVELTLEDAVLGVSRSEQSGIYLLYQQPKYRLQKIQIVVDFLMAELASGTRETPGVEAARNPL